MLSGAFPIYEIFPSVNMPEEPDLLALAALRGGFSDASPKSDVVVTRFAVQGCAVPGLGMDLAVFAVVGKALHCAMGAAFFAEIAPVVIDETQVLAGL